MDKAPLRIAQSIHNGYFLRDHRRRLTSTAMQLSILVTGAGGQLASDLLPLLRESGIASAIQELSRSELDVADEASVLAFIRSTRPSLVINLAAYNLVDKAEQERDLAFRVNTDGPRFLAAACLEAGAKLVHISTDHVFGRDESRRAPYFEDDEPGPVSVYGQSKLAGEERIRESGCRHLLVRTCGLYGAAATRAKGNFVTTIRRLAAERDELRVVNDQICTPSWTHDVAGGIISLLEAGAEGTVHVTNSGEASWFEVAAEIVRIQGLPARVLPVTSAEYGAAARRPAYSVLSTMKFTSLTGQSLADWRDALRSYLQATADTSG